MLTSRLSDNGGKIVQEKFNHIKGEKSKNSDIRCLRKTYKGTKL